MSSASSSNPGMGRTNREKNPREGMKVEPNVDSADSEGPMDLSMPRYGNRKRETRSSNCYFAAGRRKQPSSYDVDANEQPIDYSKKYVESNTVSAVKTNYVPRNSLNKVKIDHREREKGFSQQDNKAYPYGVYAETDLDQPTDYSLRYAEDDTDDEEKQNDAYFNGNEQEDTVKTYCTEGTPYETPFNVSSATSMSDLRLEEAKDGEGLKRTIRKNVQDPRKETTVKQPPPCEELEEEEKEEENKILTKESKNISNELVLNSSSTSIEKPVNYYDEGTPGRISRVSSLSSLDCTNEPRNEDVEETPERIQTQTTPALPVSPIPTVDQCTEEIEDAENLSIAVTDTINDEEAAVSGTEEEKGDARSVDKEGKVVTFGGEDHYAEQTPLMFSRSSSLGSLSGFEQHSIHDDRSSIVSDFSRRTSGVVSPSELPDSPTQTVPPSPRHNQKNNTNDFPSRAPPLRHFSYVKSPRSKSSVFEDNITAFKEESTPLEFSAATSLSSLTIDDEPKIVMDTKEKDYPEEARTVEHFLVNTSNEVESVEENEVKSEKEENRDRQTVRTNPDEGSDGDEDDEDILAACISMGMRNSMYKQSSNKIAENSENSGNRISSGDSTTNLVRYETSSTLDRLVADVAAVSLSPCSKIKNSIDAVVPPDTVRVYCTEDTPANISPVGSQSNLSALSMLSISGDIEKDDRNNLSEESDDDKILDDCIRVGIERSLRGVNSFSGSASATELNSSSHAVESKKCHDDEKVLDDSTESGGAKSLSGSNSFPGTASATKNPSPRHAPSMKRSELRLPCLHDSRQNFSIIPPHPSQNSETSTCHTSPRQNSDCVNDNASNYDDKILEECIRAGMTRSAQGANSFPGTAAVTRYNSPSHGPSAKECYDGDKILEDCIRTGMARGLQGNSSLPSTAVPTKHHSPRHVPTTKKSELHLSRFIETRQSFSMSPPASNAAKYDHVRQPSTDMSNSIGVDHDTSGDDDKILDDCIRAGIARTLGGRISFPTNSAKHHSPRHSATSKTSKSQVPRSTDNRQGFPGSKSSPTKSKSNSSAFDRDTSGDDDKMLDECIRAGMARTMHGTNSFPGSAVGTKLNSPRHTSSTRKYHDDNKTSDDSVRSGIPRTPHGSNSFPGTPVATKHNSPRHTASVKKSEAYSPRVNDPRQGYSMPSSSPAKRNDLTGRRISSARSNISAADHDTSGDEDKILDDCIKVGIARTLQGAVSFPSTATKHHSPRHGSATKKSQEYSAKQAFSMSSQSPSKSRDTSSRRTSSNRTNSAAVDHDTSGDDDKMLDECIKVGIARTLQGAVLFPSTVTATKSHSPRHASSTKKSEGYSTRNVDSRQHFSMPVPSSPQINGSSSHNIPCPRSNSVALDIDTSGDEDKILDDCIKVGIARTLHGTITFPSNVTKSHSPRRGPSTKKTEIYLPSNVDSRQGLAMRSPSQVKSNGNSIGRTSSPRSNSNHDHILYDESPNQSEDEAILAKCVQTAMSKACRNSLSFPKPQTTRKIPKPLARISNPESSCSSTRVTTEVFRTSVTTILIPARHRGEECFGDNSSISEEEEDSMLAQCIRSGMPRASSMPPKNTNYQRGERRTREQ